MERGFRGIWIPKAIWLDTSLTLLDKAILIEVDSLAHSEKGCYAHNSHFAEMFGCTERKVSDAMSKLIKRGLIRVTKFDGRNRYLDSCIEMTILEKRDAIQGRPEQIFHAATNESSMQTDEIFHAAPQVSSMQPNEIFYHSNTYSNTYSNSHQHSIEPEHEDEENPFGSFDDSRPKLDTALVYAMNNLMTMGHRATEELLSFVEDLSEDIVKHAIDNALDAGKRNWSYVRAILNTYVDAGVKTVGDAKVLDEKRRKKKPDEPEPEEYRPTMTEIYNEQMRKHGLA